MIRTPTTRMAAALAMGAVLLIPRPAPAQMMVRKDQPDRSIDAKASRDVVEGILRELKAAYVFPETAAKMDADLRKRLDKNEYEGITSARKLAEMLTEQLQAISKDKHLRVFYSYEPLPERPKDKEPKPCARRTIPCGSGCASGAVRRTSGSRRPSGSRGTSAIST